jgi:phage FluMu gp28-like protein
MCIYCVEIARGRLEPNDAKDQMLEASRAGNAYGDHEVALIDAINSGNTDQIKKVVKAGEKKERWL